MSTQTYLAWSLAAGGVFALLLYVAGHYFGSATAFARATHEARTKRLRRRLDKRLARGTDRYFEELRSIECAMADNAHAANTPVGNTWPNAVIAAVGSVFFGAVTVNLYAAPLLQQPPPAWSDRVMFGWLPFIGLQLLLAPYATNRVSAQINRLLGLAIIVLSIVIVFQFLHSTQRT
ncbi:hypothetical protein BH10PSE14_BH10PSE14_42990 [soil metagenome]